MNKPMSSADFFLLFNSKKAPKHDIENFKKISTCVPDAIQQENEKKDFFDYVVKFDKLKRKICQHLTEEEGNYRSKIKPNEDNQIWLLDNSFIVTANRVRRNLLNELLEYIEKLENNEDNEDED